MALISSGHHLRTAPDILAATAAEPGPGAYRLHGQGLPLQEEGDRLQLGRRFPHVQAEPVRAAQPEPPGPDRDQHGRASGCCPEYTPAQPAAGRKRARPAAEAGAKACGTCGALLDDAVRAGHQAPAAAGRAA